MVLPVLGTQVAEHEITPRLTRRLASYYGKPYPLHTDVNTVLDVCSLLRLCRVRSTHGKDQEEAATRRRRVGSRIRDREREVQELRESGTRSEKRPRTPDTCCCAIGSIPEAYPGKAQSRRRSRRVPWPICTGKGVVKDYDGSRHILVAKGVHVSGVRPARTTESRQ